MNTLRDETNDSGNWYSDFADKLISGNFLLTALEFHAELIESGKELPKLKEFFSNPGNFENLASSKPEVIYSVSLPRSSSQATLDSLDLTRYSEDGERSNDDRVAVLEFELRKARETIVALRANLTVAAETESKQKSVEKSKDVEDVHKIQKSTIKPHEQRALNFLINEYLLLHGYKLTSITFSDENESQDFDDWDDVGLNVGRPLELLSLYREGLKASGSSSSLLTSNAECQVSFDDDIQKNLKVKVTELETEIGELTSRIASMNLEFSQRLHTLENQETLELESHISLSPDPEYFEIIENIKSREESETKSDRSNGDWTKIGDKLKRESVELRSDTQGNYESLAINEKNQSILFENLTDVIEGLCDNRKNEDCEDNLEITNLDDLKLNENFQETWTESAGVDVDKQDKGKEEYADKYNHGQEQPSSFTLFHSSRNLSDKFKNEFFKNCDMNVPLHTCGQVLSDWFYQTDPNYLTVNQIIDVLSESIPKIVPNIILNKREEITPLLILSICLNPSSMVRDKLLNLLFNLKKKPQEEERRMILSALSIISQVMGPTMVENEVLPQCWEQITHKYVERRMLVAESCFILAPYVSEAMRNSLVISITKQLLQDREENVRKCAVNILALLVILTSDEDKYSQILDISLQILNDESFSVVNTAKCVLYPVLAQWSFSLKKVQSNLFHKLLNKLERERSLCVVNVIETLLPFLVMTVADSDYIKSQCLNDIPPPGKRQEFCKLCKGLCDPLLFYSGSLGKIMGNFDFCISNSELETGDWPELEWIWKIFIPALLQTGDTAWEDKAFLVGIISCFRYLCLGLGKNATNYKIKPFMQKKIQECENCVVAGAECQYSVIPLYLVGVLSINTENQQEMDVILRKFVCALPLCGVSLTPLQVAVEFLSQYQPWQILVLDGIWEGVAHQRPLVRSASAKLFQSVVHNITENLLSSKALPALITLSSDPEISVRTSSIPTLGMLTKYKDKTIKDKVYMTLQSVLQDSSNLENTAMVLQFMRTVQKIYEDCDQHFREEVIVPQTYAIAAHASQNKLTELIEVLTEVFAIVSFSQSHLSHHCISTALLPGLRCIESACGQLNLPCRDRVDSMIKEVERRVTASRETVCKTATLSSPSEPKRILASAVSTQVVVEDVKNRVTKIFHTKPNTLQNVSGIFKKKS